MAPAVHAYVGLGSNVGDRRAHLEGALRGLARTPGVDLVGASPWIETAPVGGPPGQPSFLNGAARCAVRLSARAFFERLRALEARAGRDRRREVRHGPRTLDLDLLLFGDERIDEPDLVVPHPELERRAFVLEPLAALAPELVLPSGARPAERLARLAPEAQPSGTRRSATP